MHFDRTIVAFFALFLTVYFLESIGGFYMTSAIVSIERQFQIPSKISGLMVSAGDFGYIPSVVFVSYLGGKGNRAKWIGGGCVLIAIANMLISSSNFLFPVENVSLNASVLQQSIERDVRRVDAQNLSFSNFIGGLAPELQEEIRKKANLNEITAVTPGLTSLALNYEETWTQNFEYCDVINNNNDPVCKAFYQFLRQHNLVTSMDVENLRLLSSTSYAFCDVALNRLRSMIQDIRCTNKISNFGPTATIFFGLLILGVGRTMPFSLGLPLIDDNVKKRNLPIYFAGMFFIRIMGPVMGFMMGSFFNKFYYTADPPRGVTPRDPMWIGMWWGGFLVIGTILFGPSLALFCFKAPENEDDEENEVIEEGDMSNQKPNELAKERLIIESNPREALNEMDENVVKKSPKRKSRGLALVDRHAERNSEGETVVPVSVRDKFFDFLKTISNVVKQPIYAGTIAGRIIDVLAFKGFYIFLPKYLDIQFGIPQYKINMYMGIIGVAGFAVGVIIGSVVMRLYKLEGRKVATWVAVCGGLSACLSFMNARVGCHSTLTMLGETLPNNFNLNQTCMSLCGCEGTPLYPVCDRSGRVFYSPCHAGCRINYQAFSALDPRQSPVFGGCKCVSSAMGNDGTDVTLLGEVSRDFCQDSDCDWKAKLYFTNMAISGVVGGMGVVPGVLIMLRSVPPRHRSVSLGFNGFLVSLLATLPSPIIWGTIIDYFCILWETKCDGKGACSLYATDRLRVWLHCIYGTMRLLSLLADFFVIYHAKDLKITDPALENDNEDDNESMAKPKEQNPPQIALLLGDHGDLFPKEEKSTTLPKNADSPKSLLKVHKRSLSRDFHTLNPTPDLEATIWRKSSHHIAGPITEY